MIYTIIETKEVDGKIHIRYVHVAANDSNKAARMWREWATPRWDFAALEAAYITQESTEDVVSCDGCKGEIMSHEDYEHWKRVQTRPHWSEGERIAPPWRKIQ